MFIHRFHRKAGLAAWLVLAIAGSTFAADPVEARSRAPAEKAVTAKAPAPAPALAKAKAAAPDGKFTSLDGPAETGSVKPTPELAPNCARSRKQLWVEGQGWVVRKVTTCY